MKKKKKRKVGHPFIERLRRHDEEHKLMTRISLSGKGLPNG